MGEEWLLGFNYEASAHTAAAGLNTFIQLIGLNYSSILRRDTEIILSRGWRGWDARGRKSRKRQRWFECKQKGRCSSHQAVKLSQTPWSVKSDPPKSGKQAKWPNYSEPFPDSRGLCLAYSAFNLIFHLIFIFIDTTQSKGASAADLFHLGVLLRRACCRGRKRSPR